MNGLLVTVRKSRGFSLLELIVTTALIAGVAIGATQFVKTFYQYRTAEIVCDTLLAESSRLQSEFRTACKQATEIGIYANPQASTAGPSGNVFRVTYVTNGPAVTVEFVFDSTTNEFTISEQGAAGSIQLLRTVAYEIPGIPVFSFNENVPRLSYVIRLPRDARWSGNSYNFTQFTEWFPVTAYGQPVYLR